MIRDKNTRRRGSYSWHMCHYVCFHPIFIAYIIKYIRNLWRSSRVNEFSSVRGHLQLTIAREWPQFFSRCRHHPICLQPLTKHRSRMTKRYSLIKNTGRVVSLALFLSTAHSFHLQRPSNGGNECKRFVCCFCLNLAPRNFSLLCLCTVVSTPFVDSTTATSSWVGFFFNRCQKMLLHMRCPNGHKYNLQWTFLRRPLRGEAANGKQNTGTHSTRNHF